MDVGEQFGRNLRALRLAAGMTQEGLGLAAAVHPTVVSRLERAERDPRLSTIVRLAAALGVRPGDLLDPSP